MEIPAGREIAEGGLTCEEGGIKSGCPNLRQNDGFLTESFFGRVVAWYFTVDVRG